MKQLGKIWRNNAVAQWVAPFLAAFLISLTSLTFPRAPFFIDDALSEKTVLTYAHEHGLQFGSDIVFTYGPLGFLTSRHYLPPASGLRMVVDVLLGFLVSAGICLVAWRLARGWGCLLVGVFVYLAANIDPRADLLIYIGLLCWGLLCLVESGRCLALCGLCFTLLTAFSILVKANFLIIAGLSAIAVIADLIFQGRSRTAFAFIIGLAITCPIAWLLAGQDLSNLRLFLTNALLIIRGYDQAVGLEGLETFKYRGLAVLLLALVAITIRAWTAYGRLRGRGATLLIWLILFIFSVWKHGFVRSDLYHLGFWFGFAPILVLTLEILPPPQERTRSWIRLLTLGCCLVAIATLQSFFFSSIKSSLIQPFRGFSQNLGVLLHPTAYRQQMLDQYEAAQQATQLPKLASIIGHASVDVFGQEQCYAVLGGLNYHPRPVFQSYMAYNEQLMRLNERFYLSKTAPEYVLFGLNSIDRKYPPLEDGRVLRHLLLNYELIAAEGPFLLLKSNTCILPMLELLREGTALLGEHIELSDSSGTNIWMEIQLAPTSAGSFRQVFYKPSKVRLAFWSQGSEGPLARLGAPPPMLAAGFLISPLLLDTHAMSNFYEGKESTPPSACSVEPTPGDERFWESTVRFRIYRFKNAARPKERDKKLPLPPELGVQSVGRQMEWCAATADNQKNPDQTRTP